MFRNINNAELWYIAVVMACGFITFYSLPDAVPFQGRLTMMVLVQGSIGLAIRETKQDPKDEP